MVIGDDMGHSPGHLAPTVVPATVGHDFVARDAEDPRQSIAVAFEVGDARADAEKHLLRDVLRVLLVSEPPFRERQDHRPEIIKKDLESRPISVRKTHHRVMNDLPAKRFHTFCVCPRTTVGGISPDRDRKIVAGAVTNPSGAPTTQEQGDPNTGEKETR